uniref:Uncharacterized protein n=1 Tax=Panagrellus redivivus TaxID=6233 RepID=A0A7E4VKR8_PANRE
MTSGGTALTMTDAIPTRRHFALFPGISRPPSGLQSVSAGPQTKANRLAYHPKMGFEKMASQGVGSSNFAMTKVTQIHHIGGTYFKEFWDIVHKI